MDPTPGRFVMEKFDGKGDFSLWKYKLLGQLKIQGLSSVLREESKPTTETKDADGTELKDIKVDPKAAEKDVRVRNLPRTCLSQQRWECGRLWSRTLKLNPCQTGST